METKLKSFSKFLSHPTSRLMIVCYTSVKNDKTKKRERKIPTFLLSPSTSERFKLSEIGRQHRCEVNVCVDFFSESD
ncbi:CLUMA_CG020215, isoform A [Clunio marinus]|uniref:CLUMA_CG020215, isoform A n=1 Tax=Clunio marinus TaxID=568069 RepID=A0A1J1J4B1_9DIPT|nr:CLUMA_CG020215, isoform A [Clunio marinus]